MDKAWGQTESNCVRTLFLRELLRAAVTGSVAVCEPRYSQAAVGDHQRYVQQKLFCWAISKSSGFDDLLFKGSVRNQSIFWETMAFGNGPVGQTAEAGQQRKNISEDICFQLDHVTWSIHVN